MTTVGSSGTPGRGGRRGRAALEWLGAALAALALLGPALLAAEPRGSLLAWLALPAAACWLRARGHRPDPRDGQNLPPAGQGEPGGR